MRDYKNKLRDLMKEICWFIFRDFELREKYLNELSSDDMNVNEFRRWLECLEENYEIVNEIKLMLRIWRNRRWVILYIIKFYQQKYKLIWHIIYWDCNIRKIFEKRV